MSNFAQQFAANEGRFDVDPQVVNHFSDGLYAKQMVIPKGFTACQHKHHYSHLSILAKGRVIVRTDDYNQEYIAPACIEIKAEIYHQIEALEDSVWFCIHATDEADAKETEKLLISRKD
jgi:quercetin dioxygenase-like cupin family protein